MKLKCILKYHNDPKNMRFKKGDVFEVDEVQARYLLADAPGCFKKVITRKKQVKEPPVDKAVKEPADK